MQRVHVTQDFRQPVSELFAYLSEHENLEPLFGAKIRRLSDGSDGTRNGAGSSRELKLGPLPPFVETNVEVIPDELVRYRITRGGVLKDHEGVMRFSSQGDRLAPRLHDYLRRQAARDRPAGAARSHPRRLGWVAQSRRAREPLGTRSLQLAGALRAAGLDVRDPGGIGSPLPVQPHRRSYEVHHAAPPRDCARRCLAASTAAIAATTSSAKPARPTARPPRST